MAETSLKPCPFCGGEAELERDNDHHGEWFNLGCARNWHRVGPDQACPGGYIWYTAGPEEEAEAIAAWNRRATDPAVAELVEALGAILADIRVFDCDHLHHTKKDLHKAGPCPVEIRLEAAISRASALRVKYAASPRGAT